MQYLLDTFFLGGSNNEVVNNVHWVWDVLVRSWPNTGHFSCVREVKYLNLPFTGEGGTRNWLAIGCLPATPVTRLPISL